MVDHAGGGNAIYTERHARFEDVVQLRGSRKVKSYGARSGFYSISIVFQLQPTAHTCAVAQWRHFVRTETMFWKRVSLRFEVLR